MKSIKKVYHTGIIVYENEHGELHREDGPAVIYQDGPAVIWAYDGTKHYYLKGKRYSYEDWLDRVTNPLLYKWREFYEVN